jgi:hypothetical protein
LLVEEKSLFASLPTQILRRQNLGLLDRVETFATFVVSDEQMADI